MAGVVKQILETIGLGGPRTQIHNKSDVPIYLIPYRKYNAVDPHGTFDITGEQARRIPAGDHIEVDSSKYNVTEAGGHSQIYIVFRTGERCDQRDIKSIIRDKYQGSVTVEAGEKSYLHTDLPKKGKLYLCYNEERRVIELDYNIGQIVSDIGSLKEAVLKLNDMVEALQAKVEALESRMPR